MNRYEFNITVVTDKKLNNDEKVKIIQAIRGEVGRIKKAGGYLLHDSKIIVSREITDDDIMEALRENIKTSEDEMELDKN